MARTRGTRGSHAFFVGAINTIMFLNGTCVMIFSIHCLTASLFKEYTLDYL